MRSCKDEILVFEIWNDTFQAVLRAPYIIENVRYYEKWLNWNINCSLNGGPVQD